MTLSDIQAIGYSGYFASRGSFLLFGEYWCAGRRIVEKRELVLFFNGRAALHRLRDNTGGDVTPPYRNPCSWQNVLD